jgi:hypothetical protein
MDLFTDYAKSVGGLERPEAVGAGERLNSVGDSRRSSAILGDNFIPYFLYIQ